MLVSYNMDILRIEEPADGKAQAEGMDVHNELCLRQLGTLKFWETLLDSFGNLGPIAPIMLAMVESFFRRFRSLPLWR